MEQGVDESSFVLNGLKYVPFGRNEKERLASSEEKKIGSLEVRALEQD